MTSLVLEMRSLGPYPNLLDGDPDVHVYEMPLLDDPDVCGWIGICWREQSADITIATDLTVEDVAIVSAMAAAALQEVFRASDVSLARILCPPDDATVQEALQLLEATPTGEMALEGHQVWKYYLTQWQAAVSVVI